MKILNIKPEQLVLQRMELQRNYRSQQVIHISMMLVQRISGIEIKQRDALIKAIQTKECSYNSSFAVADQQLFNIF